MDREIVDVELEGYECLDCAQPVKLGEVVQVDRDYVGDQQQTSVLVQHEHCPEVDA